MILEKNGDFPRIWKQATVIPIPKPNEDDTHQQNDRLMSRAGTEK